jgi:hypothetical protein
VSVAIVVAAVIVAMGAVVTVTLGK